VAGEMDCHRALGGQCRRGGRQYATRSPPGRVHRRRNSTIRCSIASAKVSSGRRSGRARTASQCRRPERRGRPPATTKLATVPPAIRTSVNERPRWRRIPVLRAIAISADAATAAVRGDRQGLAVRGRCPVPPGLRAASTAAGAHAGARGCGESANIGTTMCETERQLPMKATPAKTTCSARPPSRGR
jgi:hypothetical protein